MNCYGVVYIYVILGLLQSSNNAIHHTSNSKVCTLRVETTNIVITNYLRELNWYHNGNKISNSSKYSITNDNKTLVINNFANKDIGEYSVRFDGLRLYHYDKNCEQKILQVLKSYPVLRPVVFTLTSDGN